MSTRAATCRAQGGPENCRSERCPDRRAALASFLGGSGSTLGRMSGKPAAARLKPEVYVTEERVTSAPEATWQSVWVKDFAGTPVAYLKLRLGEAKNSLGDVLYAGVILCDIEVNPAYRGRNVPLAALRVIKQAYAVDRVWVGDSFGQSGYRMMQRLLAHERETGEQTLAYEPHVREEHIHPAPEDYEFVRDWATMTPMYRL